MKNNNITVGYLTYITENNKNFRLKHYQNSIKSFLSLIENFNCISVDNNSIREVKNDLKFYDFKSFFHSLKNFYDIFLFYMTYWEALKHNHDYVLFSYDDFICNEKSTEMLLATTEFMDKNIDVGCCRVAAYSLTNKNNYDCNIVSKNINPDSVRHFNTATNCNLEWFSEENVNGYLFSKTNWHYTSRPTCWRMNVLKKIMFDELENVPILQGFEKLMAQRFAKTNYLVGVLDVGMMYTTSVSDSARTNELSTNKEMSIHIDINEMLDFYKTNI
jgi:hypothetical protein